MTELVLLFIISSAIGEVIYLYDIVQNNSEIAPLMKLVWGLSILYSGLLGLTVYWYSGRKQISVDSIHRRSFRSTAHCYSGCGLGEIIGITIATLYFGGSPLSIIIGSFGFAYIFGFTLTIGPLVQEGVRVKEAISDSISTETASITVMETVAVSTDLFIIGGREIGLADPVFWVGLFFSLSVGFIAAYPVNLLLIRYGVKEGMMNPQLLREDMGSN